MCGSLLHFFGQGRGHRHALARALLLQRMDAVPDLVQDLLEIVLKLRQGVDDVVVGGTVVVVVVVVLV